VPITKQWSVVSKELLDARDDEWRRAAREGWQEIIDRKLIEWGRDPARLEDEGVEPPTKETLQRAIHLAEAFRDEGLPNPNSVVADPNGGIVFERRERNMSEVFHLWDDGSMEYQRFEGTRLVERRAL
jgi:hypothetical protein